VKAKNTIKNSDTSPAPTMRGRKRNLVFTRVFDASIAQAWNAWTDASMVKKWWGPAGFTCPVAKMAFARATLSGLDARPEGFWRSGHV
jgi:uncharacterized protein YndB with AHSA1/START domain